MTTMVTEIYDALLSAGAPDDKARRAAEALTERSTDLAGLRTELAALAGRIAALDARMASLEGKMTILLAMNGIILAAVVAGVGRLLFTH